MQSKINKLLSDFLGLDPSDITPEDSFTQDLHMTASDLTDFSEILSTAGFDISTINMAEIETLEDLYEKLI